MAFKLSCRITIGKYRFTTVHEVRVKRSMRTLMDTAVISLPAYGKVTAGKSASAKLVAIRTLFEDGDYVLIELGYNGRLKQEFEGFVRRRGLGTPLQIDCEGYSWQLRNNVDAVKFFKSTTAKELLKLVEPTTDVTVRVVDDLPLVNMRLTHANGARIAEEVKKLSQEVLNIFFISPRVLWCGLTYTPYSQNTDPLQLGTVKYRLGYNCIRDNRLKQRTVDEPVQVLYGGMLATGQTVQTASEDKKARKRVKATINNIRSADWLKKLATEKQYQSNYAGLEGAVTGFLEPFCWPGWRVSVTDAKTEQQNGTYLAEATEVIFGMSGARRIVQLGPMIGFKP